MESDTRDSLNRIENKIDKLDTRQDKMDIILVKQHLTLEEHTRRSTALEAIVLPIHKKVSMVEGALKFIGLLGIVAGIGDVILRLFFHR